MRIRNILLFGLYGRRMQDRLMFLQEVGEKGKFGWGGGEKGAQYVWKMFIKRR